MEKPILEVLAKYTKSESGAEDEGIIPPENNVQETVL